MNFASIRAIITGDVARLAGCYDKATKARQKDRKTQRKKEGRKE
jgi:hypothetical protein